ncbi:MAG: DNA-3-methyladenine glycosylase I [Rhodobacteraceae bacterium]|nr:DNA-3-methyladenine glycosylase I [Paracoccaceae bacterium]
MNLKDGVQESADGVFRCWWPGLDEEYQRYHDEEWGHPVDSDTRLFEKICLEGFQAGLSWLTILRKRDNFRKAFAGFDIDKLVKFDDVDVDTCLDNKGIVRHRKKIESVINNAHRAIELREEFGSLAAYVWQYEPKAEDRPTTLDWKTARKMTTSTESVAMSRDLKKRGWSFVGPTTVYAFMQSMGMVNDHLTGCDCRDMIEQKRAEFIRPVPKTAA